MTLRSFTRVAPAWWRQVIRQGLAALLPARWFMVEGPASTGAVFLTFDDGPHPVGTPKVLDALRAGGARATFFLQGAQAEAHPDLVRRILAEGHEIGHHSWSHGRPEATSAAQLADEATRTLSLLKTLGVTVRVFRPPHGKLTFWKLVRLWALGQTIVLWSTDPGDVFQPSGEALVDWLRQQPPRSGDVVLLHDHAAVLPDALPELISLVRSKNLTFGVVSQCFATSSAARAVVLFLPAIVG